MVDNPKHQLYERNILFHVPARGVGALKNFHRLAHGLPDTVSRVPRRRSQICPEYWENFPHKTYPPLSVHVGERMGDFDIGVFLRQDVILVASDEWVDEFEEAFDYD